MKLFPTLTAVGFLAAAVVPAAAPDIPVPAQRYPIHAKRADAYKKNYQSIGSGGPRAH